MDNLLGHIDPMSLLDGLLLGILGGLFIGWMIWERNKTASGIMADLRWTQLIGAILAAVCLLMRAPESVTIAFIALIPAENVALGIAGKDKK